MTAASVARSEYQISTNLLQEGFKIEDVERDLERARSRASVPLEPFSYQILEAPGGQAMFFAWARVVE